MQNLTNLIPVFFLPFISLFDMDLKLKIPCTLVEIGDLTEAEDKLRAENVEFSS